MTARSDNTDCFRYALRKEAGEGSKLESCKAAPVEHAGCCDHPGAALDPLSQQPDTRRTAPIGASIEGSLGGSDGSSYVVILAADLNGLGAIRSACKAGLKPIVVSFSPKDISRYSRLCLKHYYLEDVSSTRLREVLKEISIEFGPASLIACSDMSAELLSDLSTAEIQPHVRVSPAADTVRLLNDKLFECKALEAAGVRLPKTYYEVDQCTADNLPIIIKPRTYKGYKTLGKKNVIIETWSELSGFIVKQKSIIGDLIAQAIIPGSDESLWVCNVTFDQDSNLVGFFSFSRLGTMPSHYGVTSIAVSRRNPALEEQCKLLGKALGYTGPAMIEFKQDPSSDRYYYIETNPRPGTCNWFDTQCGINNIKLCHDIAFGSPVEKAFQKEDIYYFNFFGDLTARLENRESLAAIGCLYLSLLSKRTVSPTLTWYDPAPWFVYSGENMKVISTRVTKKLRIALLGRVRHFLQTARLFGRPKLARKDSVE